MKVSHDHDKVTIPGEKEAYRLYNSANEPVLDLLVQVGTSVPQAHKRILCRHPFDANRRVYVTPHRVEPLHQLAWDGSIHSPASPNHANVLSTYPSLSAVRDHVAHELQQFREDHLRRLNPTPYKLSVSSDLYSFMADLWLQEVRRPTYQTQARMGQKNSMKVRVIHSPLLVFYFFVFCRLQLLRSCRQPLLSNLFCRKYCHQFVTYTAIMTIILTSTEVQNGRSGDREVSLDATVL